MPHCTKELRNIPWRDIQEMVSDQIWCQTVKTTENTAKIPPDKGMEYYVRRDKEVFPPITNAQGIEIRDSFLEKYFSYCTVKYYYICATQKRIDLNNPKEYVEKQAKKEQAQCEEAIAKEQRLAARMAKLL